MNPLNRRLHALTLLGLVRSRQLAFAAPPTLQAQAKAYAEKNNLPLREFKHDLGNHAAFWRALPQAPVHGLVSLGPKELLHFTNQTEHLLTNEGVRPLLLNRARAQRRTPKNHVDHIVTEWGSSTLLRGMNDADRVAALIAIAHPIHRAQLADAALAAGRLSQEKRNELVGGVHDAIVNAPIELRRHAADLALKKNIFAAAEHAAIVANCPPLEAAI